MPDILANPNALPARADMQVRSDGILDLANFVAEVVPAPDSVLASLGGDLREYGKLRRDDQVAALMQQRQDKLVEAEWEVIPGGDAPADVAAADFLREQLAGFNFDAACRKMHGSLLYGYGVAECLWGRDGSRITLRDIRVRAPWRFGFAKDRQLKLLVESRWLVMPPRKFWLVTWGAEDDDNPYGMGLGHQLWWPVYLKRNGARFWAAYLDRFGVPTTKAVYPSDESDAENEKRKKDALAAALSLRSEGAVPCPRASTFPWWNPPAGAAGTSRTFWPIGTMPSPRSSFPRPALRASASTAARPRSTAASAPAWSRLTRICCASLSIPARRSG